MGRSKYFRHRTRYLIEKVAEKGIDVLLKRELIEDFGASQAEAEILALRSIRHLTQQRSMRLPNQIIVEARTGITRFAKSGKVEIRKIAITPCAPEDLALYRDYGLSALQSWRLVRVLREAGRQDALLSRRFLGVLFNMTSGALRTRLSAFTERGIRLPFQGQPKKDRVCSACELSTFVIKAFLRDSRVEETIKLLKIPKSASGEMLWDFAHYCHLRACGCPQEVCSSTLCIIEPTILEWESVRTTKALQQGIKLLTKRYPAPSVPELPPLAKNGFVEELKNDFGFSSVKARLWVERLEEMISTIGNVRDDNEIVYSAVSVEEPAGKPISACRMVPVVLKYLSQEDFSWNAPGKGKDDSVSPIKFGKMLRYTTAAKFQGAVLTQGDLCFLLGVHTNCIRRLIKRNDKVVLPTRGQECDIGPGVSHKEKIVELYLQMYTETEIARRTGHSYASIEQYIKDFSAVVSMFERGLNEVMIRKILGRSMRLIRAYLELYERYNTKEYAFRLAHIRQIFNRHSDEYGGGKNLAFSFGR